jgi:hypothetical protein
MDQCDQKLLENYLRITMDQHKFSLFEKVYLRDDKTDYGDSSRCWYITGIHTKHGLEISQGYYEDCYPEEFYITDVVVKHATPEQLMTVQEFEESQQGNLLREIEQCKQKISALMDTLEVLEEARLAKR